METIFKEGQKVVDKVFRKGKEGIVRLISKNKFRNFILVDFEDSTPALYTFDGVLFDIDGEFIDANPTLFIDDTVYIKQEDFDKIPTVEDAIKYLERKNDLYIVDLSDTCDFEEVYTSKEMYDAFEALKSLIFLRDYYNDGWKPKIYSYVYIITTRNGELVKDCLIGDFRVLYFKSQEISNRFFEEQR